MDYIQFTEFRNASKLFFDQVEQGKRYVIVRRGKPIAELIPFGEVEKREKVWKRTVEPVRLKKGGLSTTDMIRQGRDGK